MKKIYLLAAVSVLGLTSLFSCKKNPETNDIVNLCRCGYNSKLTGKDSVITVTELSMYYSTSKAEENCKLRADTLQHYYPNIICDLNF